MGMLLCQSHTYGQMPLTPDTANRFIYISYAMPNIDFWPDLLQVQDLQHQQTGGYIVMLIGNFPTLFTEVIGDQTDRLSLSQLVFVGDFAGVYIIDHGIMMCIRICCDYRKPACENMQHLSRATF